jgi:hypothetical protein
MYDGMSLGDQSQLFGQSLLLYDGKFVKVKSIHEELNYRLFNIKTQKTSTVKVSLNKFAPPMKRLGMINIGGSVFYIYRRPIRQFSVGLTKDNIRVESLDVPYPERRGDVQERVRFLECVELEDCLMNVYPSIAECIAENKILGGAMAFDKQFAIDCHRRIFYKTQYVGDMAKNCSTVQKIVWLPGFSHLNLLLEKNYEKDLRDSAPRIN